ncbi:MBL fold metallo-hydrolase [Sphingobacterium phlebotomi]|uniref:MBL fold metallo-hydrolase n=1 Tax=Sphingobacterium phlebotomi TaxID=2605433 RepID=A0A5D4H920_9SPHI|nr:MBL fold metallo-hydrolase [Sphingobacterium phlebotomi]TYR37107.1 MBL fold metallo-hydrolase [Sphingobacterium phlebotomi]
MNYCALASGSNGNCYYIANAENAILIDVGINAKHVELRMANLGIAPTTIKAIFITHEHTDHIRGLAVFCKRYQIPVYMTIGSYRGSRLQLPENLVHIIRRDEVIEVGSLTICGVPKYHDAQEPCSFLVSDGETNIGVLTDIGRVCDNVKHVIQQADILLWEANYDEELLDTGSYPFFLKNRIRNGWGHLSNHTALETVLKYRTCRLRHLILGHLSGQNNSVELVRQTFAPHFRKIKLSIATRYQETELFDSRALLPPLATKIIIQQVSYQATFVFPES